MIFKFNMAGYTATSIVKGSLVGGLSGGITSTIETGNFEAFGEGDLNGAIYGAIGGAAGATSGVVGFSVAASAAGAGEGAVAGGAFEAGVSGLAASGASYTTTWALGKSGGWNWGEFGMSLLQGAGSGALMGGATSLARYGLSDAYQQQTYQTIEDYGYEKERHTDVIDFDYGLGQKQRAIDYYAHRVRGYDIDFKYDAIRNQGFRGLYENGSVSIYDEAFMVDGQYDATSMMATIDHENNHHLFNKQWMAEAKRHGYDGFGYINQKGVNKVLRGTAFVEARNYHLGITQAERYGYSTNVKNYLNGRYKSYSNWEMAEIFKYDW